MLCVISSYGIPSQGWITDQELLTLWANDQKRREFVKNYNVWGEWFTQPELDLTFYKYDLPGGGRLIAMEYLREPYANERQNGSEEAVTNHKFYLQRGQHFNPSAASEYEIADRLKDIKGTLHTEQKQRNRECKKCGSRCFQHKPDGTILCTACMTLVA